MPVTWYNNHTFTTPFPLQRIPMPKCLRLITMCFVAAFVGLLGTLARPALAQETVSGEVWLGGQLFSSEDLDTLRAVAGLSDEEAKNVGEILQGAMVEARILDRKFSESFRKLQMSYWEDPELQKDHDKYTKKMADMVKAQTEKVEALEKGTLADVKLLLSNDQVQKGWAKFIRARQRLVLRGEGLVRSDIAGLVRGLKLSDEERKQIDPLLESHETTMSQLTADIRPLIKIAGEGQGTGPGRWFRERPEPSEADSTRYQNLIKKLQSEYIQTAQKIEPLLSSENRDGFIRLRVKIEGENTGMVFTSKNDMRTRSILRMRSLSKAQREELKGIIKKSDEEYFELNKKLLRHVDALRLKGEEFSWDDEEYRKLAKDGVKITEKLYDTLFAKLTPAQQEAIGSGLQGSDDAEEAFRRPRRPDRYWWGGNDGLFEEELQDEEE
jgi:hypothetical protein